MRKKLVNCDEGCPLCSGVEETEMHLYFEWPKLMEVWSQLGMIGDIQQALEATSIP